MTSGLDAAQQMAQAAVRSMAEPVADAEFRARQRAAFVRGDFVSRPSPRRAPAPSRRRWRIGVPVAVAAVLALFFLATNPAPGLELTAVQGTQQIVVDGVEMSCADLSPIQAALHPGCRLELPEGARLELASESQLLMEVEGSAELVLPSMPGRWFGRNVESDVVGNAVLRVATGDAFEGSTYRLRGEMVELEVGHSALEMRQNDDGLTLDVLDGEVVAHLDNGEVRTVVAGHRFFYSAEDRRTVEEALPLDAAPRLRLLRRRLAATGSVEA